MARPLDGRDVFIASPSGLDDERRTVVSAIADFNQSRAHNRGVVLIPRGWEEVPGGLGRPQSLINKVIDQSDFLVVILADRWGSNPGGNDGFTSGTEEEFSRAIELLADPDALLRDIVVLFRSIDPDRLADPGPELDKVLQFRERLERSKQILYGTFDSFKSLTARLDSVLEKWSEPLGPREPLEISIPPAADPAPVSATNDRLGKAIELADAGHLVRAELLFAQASEDGDPRALTEFARFVRRLGRLNDALSLNERVVADLGSLDERDASSDAYLVDSLANIGVIARKQGDLNRSIRSLREAVSVAREATTPAPTALAYSLDNLGHSLSQLRKYDEAEAFFKEALALREDTQDEKGQSESKRNIGWLLIRTGDFDGALRTFSAAVEADRAGGDKASLAKSLSGLGSALIKLGRSEDAVAPLRESVDLNRDLGQSDGVSIASGLLANAQTSLGDLPAAKEAAAEVIRESSESGNSVGAITGAWSLAKVARTEGKLPQALELFEEAIKSARATGNSALALSIEHDLQNSHLI